MEATTAWLVEWPDNWLEPLSSSPDRDKKILQNIHTHRKNHPAPCSTGTSRVKRPRHMADHSSLSNMEVKN